MKQSLASVLLVLVVASVPASGQPVFIDEFNGNALAPHWVQPPPSHWVHNVSRGMLSVQDLLYPSTPKAGWNHATIAADIPPVAGDFVFSTRMGWDASIQGSRRLMLATVSDGTGLIGSFVYQDELSGASVNVWGGVAGTSQTLPAPATGMHDFSVQRFGTTVRFFLDGAFLHELPTSTAAPAARILLTFQIAWPNQGLSAMHVDSVVVIPDIPSVCALTAGAIGSVLRRRR